MLALAAAFGPPSSANAQVIVLPLGTAKADADSNNAYPFGLNDYFKYQQVFAAADFTAQGVNRPIAVTSIAFRPDAGSDSFSTVFPSVTVRLSTTQVTPDGLSSLYAANVGNGQSIVYDGRLSINHVEAGASPEPFELVVPVATPFPYDPTHGNLLLQIEINTMSGSNRLTYFDAANDAGDGVSRVQSASYLDTVGFPDTIGLVTQFTFTPIPEPSTLALAGATIVSLAGLFRRKWRIIAPRPPIFVATSSGCLTARKPETWRVKAPQSVN